jgi:CheY-like chemotaxis protein
MDRRTQVVLGEAETDGFLRFVLEGEGFDVIGLASSDDELDRVLEGAHPAVIVLDAGISVIAALRAKDRATGATIVTVWPDDVAATLAEQRVDPYDVVDALGPAVRSAAARAVIPEPTPDVAEELGRSIRAWRAAEPILLQAPIVRREPVELPRRGVRRALVLAATWLLIVTALGSIATAIPNALEEIRPVRSPSPTRSTPAPSSPSPIRLRSDLAATHEPAGVGVTHQRR